MDIVKNGYNQIAKSYLDNRDQLKSAKYIQLFLKHLPKKSMILDLGCGAGVPVDDMLQKAGHDILGLDISEVQIDLARLNCKYGSYECRDLKSLSEGEFSVAGIVCLYTLFHISRMLHGQMLTKMASFLPKNGLLLITMGDREYEGNHSMYGVKMWSSQFGPKKNSKMILESDFEILLDEIDLSGGERHQYILARKNH